MAVLSGGQMACWRGPLASRAFIRVTPPVIYINHCAGHGLETAVSLATGLPVSIPSAIRITPRQHCFKPDIGRRPAKPARAPCLLQNPNPTREDQAPAPASSICEVSGQHLCSSPGCQNGQPVCSDGSRFRAWRVNQPHRAQSLDTRHVYPHGDAAYLDVAPVKRRTKTHKDND
jgi:hypothetical protein